MEKAISEFSYFLENRGIRWSYGGRPVERIFDGPVQVVPFKSGQGMLVVELSSQHAPNSAIILNLDGTQRVRIRNPEANRGAIDFGSAYYIENELTLIIEFAPSQYGCVIDEEGNVLRTYETR